MAHHSLKLGRYFGLACVGTISTTSFSYVILRYHFHMTLQCMFAKAGSLGESQWGHFACWQMTCEYQMAPPSLPPIPSFPLMATLTADKCNRGNEWALHVMHFVVRCKEGDRAEWYEEGIHHASENSQINQAHFVICSVCTVRFASWLEASPKEPLSLEHKNKAKINWQRDGKIKWNHKEWDPWST